MNCSIRRLVFLGLVAWRAYPESGKVLPLQDSSRVTTREITHFDPGESGPVRVKAHFANGLLYILFLNGDLWEVNPKDGAKRKVLRASEYVPEDTQCLGLWIDEKGKFYIVANERRKEERPQGNHVVVFRWTKSGQPPDEFASFDHPWGVGPFNHGANHIATGPDGLLYLSVGSRTDHGEKGNVASIDKGGETPFTATIVRFDPAKEKAVPEVFARGLRNTFGFDWDDEGRLIGGDNGPDADHPEKLNWIRQGLHYGFPYRFGNNELPRYPDAVPAQEGQVFEAPIAIQGPEGLRYSFAPHASPAGMVFCREGKLPEKYKKTFFVTRFGNFLGSTKVGFDLWNIKLETQEGKLTARAEIIVSSLRRPIDICLCQGMLYIVEWVARNDTLPGRLLEVRGE